jgi:hypothetical protein
MHICPTSTKRFEEIEQTFWIIVYPHFTYEHCAVQQLSPVWEEAQAG